MRHVTLLVTLAALSCGSLAGCGGDVMTTSDERAGRETTQGDETVQDKDNSRRPVPAQPDTATPSSKDESAEWIVAHLSVYEEAYRACDEEIQTTSNPNSVWTLRDLLVEEARKESEQAAWVASTGCGDGVSQTPWPIPELERLRP